MPIHYGWHCVCDEMSIGISKVSEKSCSVKLLNRFDLLQHVGSNEHDEVFETTDVNATYSVMSCNKHVANIKQSGLRSGIWNFKRLCNDRKALEVDDILHKNSIDIIGGQESWELDYF